MSSRFGRFFSRFATTEEEQKKVNESQQSQQRLPNLQANMEQVRRDAIERREKERQQSLINYERQQKERINSLGFDPYDPSHREYLADLEQRNPELRAYFINRVERYEKEQKEKQQKMMLASNQNRSRNQSSRHHSRRDHSNRNRHHSNRNRHHSNRNRHHSNRNRHHSNRNRHYHSRRIHRSHRESHAADPGLPEVNLDLSMDPIDIPNNRNSAQQQANSSVAQNSRNIQAQNNPNLGGGTRRQRKY